MGAEELYEVEFPPESIIRRRNNVESLKDLNGRDSYGGERTFNKSMSSRSEKATELLNQLVEFSALPEYLQDNSFILRHYRADWPLKHSLLSIFSMHNETFNIWSYVLSPFRCSFQANISNCDYLLHLQAHISLTFGT